MSVREKRSLIFPEQKMPIWRQCNLLGLTRSSYYYAAREPKGDTELMNEIMDIWTEYPFYGYRRITDELVDLPGKLFKLEDFRFKLPRPVEVQKGVVVVLAVFMQAAQAQQEGAAVPIAQIVPLQLAANLIGFF